LSRPVFDHLHHFTGRDSLGAIISFRQSMQHRHGLRANRHESCASTIANRVVWIDHFLGQSPHPGLDRRVRLRLAALAHRPLWPLDGAAPVFRYLLLRPLAVRRLIVARLREYRGRPHDTGHKCGRRQYFLDPEHEQVLRVLRARREPFSPLR
jgi:hypothetical protein